MVKKRTLLVWAVAFSLAMLGLIAIRSYNIHQNIAISTDCKDCKFSWEAPAYDGLIIGTLIFFIGLAGIAHRLLRPLIAISGFALIITYSTDIFITELLNVRINIADIIKYSKNIQINNSVAHPLLRSPLGFALSTLTAISSAAFLILTIKIRHTPKITLTFIIAATALIGTRNLPTKTHYAASHIYQDFITNNLPSGVDTPYSENFHKKLTQAAPPQESCLTQNHRPKPIILIIVESLSLYQSKKLSSIEDYTPELDKITEEYSHLKEFYANGFSTDGGLIALLTGHTPIPNINRYNSTNIYNGFEKSKQDLFQKLQANKIETNYFSTSDLNFIGMGDWLKNLGISHIEGPENPFYKDLPRGSFNDPGDRALYERYLQWYDHERSSHPFFSVIQTITTHPPFIIPGFKDNGEKAAVRYADQALGKFVGDLKNRGFLDQGFLIIVGDHRSMTIQRAEEAHAIGPAAHARVPAIIVSADHRGIGEIPGQWQQADLIPSVLAAMGLPSCTSDFQGRFLEPRQQPRYILHAQGAERDRVLVKVKDDPDLLFVKLDGDHTRWVKPPRSPNSHDQVIDQINRQRANVTPADANLAAGLLRWKGLMP